MVAEDAGCFLLFASDSLSPFPSRTSIGLKPPELTEEKCLFSINVQFCETSCCNHICLRKVEDLLYSLKPA